MAISLYRASVPVFLQLLGGLKGVLEKAETQASARKFDANVLVNWRLFPDMFTLASQVREASEHAFSAGRVAGVDVPKLPEIDSNFEELKARIDNTMKFLKTISPVQIDDNQDVDMTIRVDNEPQKVPAHVYLLQSAMPNFYFHVTTAYNIFRELGIEIGKSDFIGKIPLSSGGAPGNLCPNCGGTGVVP